MTMLSVAALLLLASGTPPAAAKGPAQPASVVVLRDGTRYTLAKPVEIRGTQARLFLTNGTLVAVRASEIDEAASKRAIDAATAPPTSATTPTPPTLAGAAIAPPTSKSRVVITDEVLATKGTGKGTLTVSGSSGGTPDMTGFLEAQTAEAAAAQERMDKAMKDGLWTANNIRHHQGIRLQARAEWEAAAENCRKTPGCKPGYRPDGVLMTDQEAIDAIVKSGALSR